MAEPARGEKRTPDTELEPHDAPTALGPRIRRGLGWGLPLASIAAAVACGYSYGLGTAILVLAGGLLLGIVAILWASVRTLSGDAAITLEEAIAFAAPSETEEQKRAVLQALKDLEYERSVGKVAEADYQDLLQRYRAEAKRLLRAVDEDLAPLRAKANAYLASQLNRPSEGAVTRRACAACRADNDADALFCKKCGGKLDGSQEHHNATA